jgi:hypothetical protein
VGACSGVCACIYMDSRGGRGGGKRKRGKRKRGTGREKEREGEREPPPVYAQLSTQGAKCSTPGDLHHKCWENIVERSSQAET